jgi:hypothetical protein
LEEFYSEADETAHSIHRLSVEPLAGDTKLRLKVGAQNALTSMCCSVSYINCKIIKKIN